MYDQCRYEDALCRSVKEQTSIHSYTSQYGSSYTLLFLRSCRSIAYSPPACHQHVIKSHSISLWPLRLLPPPLQTEIPVLFCMFASPRVVVLLRPISISDMGIWGVRLSEEKTGEGDSAT